MTASCLIADDHPAVLTAMADVLREHGHAVVGTADNGVDAAMRIASLRPDVAIIDARMPQMSGTDVARAAAKHAPTTAVLFYTGYADRALLQEAFDIGARGFLLKDAPLEGLAHAVRTVASGGRYVDGSLASSLLNGADRAKALDLTAREREVLREVAAGRGYDEIGARLYLSPHTVATHVRNATKHLGATTKTAAVATALRLSLIT